MIESISVRNFQKHSKLKIEFDPRITVLSGRSDLGKSSILRALRWCIFNRPQGEQFVSWGSEDGTKVTVKVDGKTVTRERTNGENVYRTGGQEYKALRGEVPEAVTNLFNVSDAGFSDQIDPPFWFKKTPGQVSQELNAIVNLDLIDRTMAGVAAELRKGRAAAAVTAERLAKAKESSERLAWVDEANAGLERVEDAGRLLEETREKRSRIADLVLRASSSSRRSAIASQAKQDALLAVRAGERAAERGERAERLREILNESTLIVEALERAERELEGAKSELGKVCPVCGKPA